MARRHHTGILREGMCVASRCPPLGLLPIPFLLSLFLRTVPRRTPILAATFMPPRGHPTLVVLSPAPSSSSSIALLCLVL